MTYYITKYALTSGIREVSAENVSQVSSDMIAVKEKYTTYFHGAGKDWHVTKGAAIARAYEMRRKKIDSLKKSLAKLEKINFCEKTIQ